MTDTAISVAPSVGTTRLGIVFGLALGPAVGLGLGRFAYALLLPSMRVDLGWSYAQAGAMNTANAAGYLLGALAAAPLAGQLGDKRAFLLGLLMTAVGLFATGSVGDYRMLLVLRALAGAAGALSLITGGALAAAAGHGGSKDRSAVVLGVYFGGAGFGMVVSAFAVPELVAQVGWRAGWFALGALGVASAAVSMRALANAPEVAPAGSSSHRIGALRAARRMVAVLVSYILFGAGYIAYTTFIVAWLRQRLDFAAGDVTLFWVCVGLAATGAGLVWGPLLARLTGGRGVAAANAVVALGTALPVLIATRPAVYASAVLFGGSFLIVPTSVTAFARKATPPRAWTASIAVLTVGFAIGQCVGPWLSGVVSDTRFGLAGGLLLSGAILAGAALIALAQTEPHQC
jgi:predicted MFS family arabinose efflux permease